MAIVRRRLTLSSRLIQNISVCSLLIAYNTTLYSSLGKHAPLINPQNPVPIPGNILLPFVSSDTSSNMLRTFGNKPMHSASHLPPQPIINSYFHLTRNTRPAGLYSNAKQLLLCIGTVIIPCFRRDHMRVIGRRCSGNGSSGKGGGQEEGARMTFLQGARNLKLRHWVH